MIWTRRSVGHRQRFLAVLVSCLALTTGCSDSAPPDPVSTRAPQPWSGYLADYRLRWTAEPGIDLVTGPAVFLRAYVESFDAVSLTGDINRAYPGFIEAVPPNEAYERGKPHSPGALGRFPDQTAIDRPPLVGNSLHQIESIDIDEPQLVAIVCHWNYTMAYRVHDGEFASVPTSDDKKYDRETDGISASRIKLTKRETGTPPPSTPQQGPEPAPVSDVFGGWMVAGRNYAPLGNNDEDWPSWRSDLDTCVAKAPDPLERRKFLMTGEHPRSDFPTLPASPGWPLESN